MMYTGSGKNKSLKNHQTTLFLNVFSDFYFKCEQHKDAAAIKISKILNILNAQSGKTCLLLIHFVFKYRLIIMN